MAPYYNIRYAFDRFTVVDENRNLRVNRIRLEKQTGSCSLTKQNLVSIYCNEGFGLGIKQDRYATTVLGFKISMSTMVAPTAMQKMAHPEEGCSITKLLLQTLSSWATSSVEEVGSTGPGIRFFQLYVSSMARYNYSLMNVVAQLVRRAESAGFKAIALTNFEGLDLGKMDMANDSGLASYVAGQIDRTLSWKVKQNSNQ
ncbi:unnamed protein product [Brassica rapa]|uniref:FMN-dependent dehydrogenase domain-containing protein n=1 Tax=Brassica campestris TaxID=3711 RepID=A0A8D9MAH2_BRACM|nr:unnamed protein product [Brassica rapa]